MLGIEPFCSALVDIIWQTKSLVEELAGMMDVRSRTLLPHGKCARIVEARAKICSLCWILCGDVYAVRAAVL